jgi:hypothetical protein
MRPTLVRSAGLGATAEGESGLSSSRSLSVMVCWRSDAKTPGTTSRQDIGDTPSLRERVFSATTEERRCRRRRLR